MTRPGSKFIGLQETLEPGLYFRLYNVTGKHRLSGSTVTLDELVDNGIPVLDIPQEAVDREYAELRRFLKS